MWRKYIDLEPMRRLRNQGRELLGEYVLMTEKRDGENVSIWLADSGGVRISSHNMEIADDDITRRFKETPEYMKAVSLLDDELKYNGHFILYGELLKTVGATKIEPKRKHLHWILFDIWDIDHNRFLPYNLIYQKAYHYKIPIVKAVGEVIPESMDELIAAIEQMMEWCKRHRREGVVVKSYGKQVFFVENIENYDKNTIKFIDMLKKEGIIK